MRIEAQCLFPDPGEWRANDLRYALADGAADPDWVDEYLLGGNNDDRIVPGRLWLRSQFSLLDRPLAAPARR
jgi:hypothetical protein